MVLGESSLFNVSCNFFTFFFFAIDTTFVFFFSSSNTASAMPSSFPDIVMPIVQQSSSIGVCSSLTPQSLTFPYGALSSMPPPVLTNGVSDGDVISSSAGDMCRVCADSRRFLADNNHR